MNTIETIQKQLNKLKQAEYIINRNPFLKQQMELGNIKLTIDLISNVYLETTILDKGIEGINHGDIPYTTWKEKTRREFNKIGFFHDKHTYMKYKLKEN
jgi:hypothetical protein